MEHSLVGSSLSYKYLLAVTEIEIDKTIEDIEDHPWRTMLGHILDKVHAELSETYGYWEEKFRAAFIIAAINTIFYFWNGWNWLLEWWSNDYKGFFFKILVVLAACLVIP
ncbi:MAG: hypothetical protein ACREPG_01290, partial [Candidatus Binatia bacterium]